eukprot:gene175-788_t
MSNLNEILNIVYQRDVALNDTQTKQLTSILTNFLEYFREKMKEADPLFNLLFKNNIHYGGSYYDGLRIGEATEFDLNIILRFPFQENIMFDTTSVPGYVFVGLSRPVDQLIPLNNPNYPTYKKIDKFIGKDNKFMPGNVRNWFEGVCSKARLLAMHEINKFNIAGLKLRKSGPALTLEIQPRQNLPMISVDLVPVIQKGGNADVMYCVPKSHHRDALYLWRCSFPQKEQAILKNSGCAKMVIKLLKKMRDRQGWHCLASYYLKTVVMLCKVDAVWAQNKIGDYFILALEQLSSYLQQSYIPFYHENRLNLVENIKPITLANINGRLVLLFELFTFDDDYYDRHYDTTCANTKRLTVITTWRMEKTSFASSNFNFSWKKDCFFKPKASFKQLLQQFNHNYR